jgi:hypothetical protein
MWSLKSTEKMEILSLVPWLLCSVAVFVLIVYCLDV